MWIKFSPIRAGGIIGKNFLPIKISGCTVCNCWAAYIECLQYVPEVSPQLVPLLPGRVAVTLSGQLLDEGVCLTALGTLQEVRVHLSSQLKEDGNGLTNG